MINMLELNAVLLQTGCLGLLVLSVIGIGLFWMYWTDRIPLVVLIGVSILCNVGLVVVLFAVAAINGIPASEVIKVLFWFQMLNNK
jgi:hypothetical protein